jgi:hypothetical protein
LFKAPGLGIDETTSTGTNLFTVWIGGQDAVFEVLSPAFDTTANWSAFATTTGSRPLLTATTHGLLTPITGTAPLDAAHAIAELLSVETTDKILIRLNRFA